MEVVASLSQGRTAAAQCGLSTHKSVPVIFEPPCIKIKWLKHFLHSQIWFIQSKIIVFALVVESSSNVALYVYYNIPSCLTVCEMF